MLGCESMYILRKRETVLSGYFARGKSDNRLILIQNFDWKGHRVAFKLVICRAESGNMRSMMK